jgi:cytoskeleton protein RodZ
MDVGLELRQARERRELTIRQLSDITKISPRVLKAIETCDEPALPAVVYTRAFVKTYARETGLDPEDTMRRYLAQFHPPEEAAPPMPAPDPVPAAARPNLIHVTGLSEDKSVSGIAAMVIVAATIGALATTQRWRSPDSIPSPPLVMAAGLAPAAAPQPEPVGTTGTTPANGLHLAIAPTGPCWMQATSGGNRLFAALLNPGERRSVDTTSEVTLRIGDPAACAFTINGKPARIPGAPAQATTVVITRGNYREFLAR